MSPIVATSNSQSSFRRSGWLWPPLGSLALCLALALGCGGNTGGGGTGGRTGSGGTAASGGATSGGGTVGSGGTTASGGTGGETTGAGGTTAKGGTTGAGGTTAKGGTTGAGGTTSLGGNSGSGGASSAGGDTSGSGGSVSTGGQTGRDGGPGSGGNAAGSSGTGGSNAGGSSGSNIDGGSATAVPSAGCGKAPTLKNSPSNTTFTQNTLTISGKSRQFIIRWPDNYNNQTPYRLIIGLHGATGKGADVAGSSSSEGPYFGLWDLSQGSTIFIAPSADGGLWDATNDTAFVSEILKTVEADLCIDTTRIMLEGFSQGAAMSWTLACGLTGVFRAVVGHSGGGVANPTSCKPIPYFGSGGKQENVTQTTQTDQFAKWNGCTVSTLATAPTGGHVCSNYSGCPAADPVRWCNYDGPHTPSPTDSGKSASWMPSETWPFFSQF